MLGYSEHYFGPYNALEFGCVLPQAIKRWDLGKFVLSFIKCYEIKYRVPQERYNQHTLVYDTCELDGL